MSIKERFQMGDKIMLVPKECNNGKLHAQIGKVFTIKSMTKCFNDNTTCKDRPDCEGYGVRVNETSINDTSWCCYVFKRIKRGRLSTSNLALPSQKDWRKIIGK